MPAAPTAPVRHRTLTYFFPPDIGPFSPGAGYFARSACHFFASRRQARTAGLTVLATAAFLLMFGGGYGLGTTSAHGGGSGS